MQESTKPTTTSNGCYFEINDYGFRQKRIYGENLSIPRDDPTRGVEFDEILNPKNVRYGSVTKYLAIDVEMDQISSHALGGEGVYCGYGQNVPCKVTVVNEQGVVVLDTLIRLCINGEDISNISEVEGYRSVHNIHGIKSEWLEDAPTFGSVREHILELCGAQPSQQASQDDEQSHQPESTYEDQGSPKQDGSPVKELQSNEEGGSERSPEPSVFIGHGVVSDLRVLDIYGVSHIDTQVIDREPIGPRKLKHLVSKHLNAQIQKGHHSAIIDARATLALFLKLRAAYGLDVEGFGVQMLPAQGTTSSDYGGYMGAGILTSRRRRRTGGVTLSQLCTRQAFKTLHDDGNRTQEQGSAKYFGTPQAVTQFDQQHVIPTQAEKTKATSDLPFSKIDLEIQNLILGGGASRITSDRRYKLNKKELEAQIEAVVRKEFTKVFRKLTYCKIAEASY